jgi:hypothetical protein
VGGLGNPRPHIRVRRNLYPRRVGPRTGKHSAGRNPLHTPTLRTVPGAPHRPERAGSDIGLIGNERVRLQDAVFERANAYLDQRTGVLVRDEVPVRGPVGSLRTPLNERTGW